MVLCLMIYLIREEKKTCEIAKEKTLDVFRKVGLGRN